MRKLGIKKHLYRLFTLVALVASFLVVVNLNQPTARAEGNDKVFEMTDGVSLKLNDGGGIRFRIKMSPSVKEEIFGGGTATESGAKLYCLVTPRILFDRVADGKYENMSESQCVKAEVNDENKVYLGEDGYYYVNVCNTNIAEANRRLDYVSIAYIKRGETTEYATAKNQAVFNEDGTVNKNFDVSDVRGNLYDVLNSAVLDTENDYYDKVFGSESYTWFGNADYPVLLNSAERYNGFVSKVKSGKTFEGKSVAVANGIVLNKNDFVGVSDEVFNKLSAEVLTKYKVTFDNNSKGDKVSSQYVTKDGKAVSPICNRLGYALKWKNGDKEWKFETDAVTSDITLTAEWTTVNYKITVNSSFAEPRNIIFNVENRETVLKTLKTEDDAQYHYEITDIPEKLLLKDYNLTETRELRKYKVEFYNYDDSLLQSVTLEYGTEITAPEAPQRASDKANHYDFNGWGSLGTVKGDAKFTAEYTAVAHEFTGAVCSCGYEQTQGLTYAYNADRGGYAVTGYTGEDSVVYVRSRYDDGTNGDHAVVAVGGRAFYTNQVIVKVIFPESVNFLAPNAAFGGCSNLEYVALPGLISNVYAQNEGNHFANCNKLKTVILGKSFSTNCQMFYSDSTPDNPQCDIYLYSDDGTFGNFVTEENQNLLSGKVYKYDANNKCGTWKYNEDKTDVILNAEKHLFVDGICSKCGYWQKEITYTYDESKNGYVITGYSGSETEIYARATYNDGTHGEKNVVSIGSFAFDGKTVIVKAIFPKTVTSWGAKEKGAIFRDCTNLEYVALPGLTKNAYWTNGNNQFAGCRKLRTVILGKEFSTDCQVFYAEAGTAPETPIIDIYLYSEDGTFGDFKPHSADRLLSGKVYKYNENGGAGTWKYNEDKTDVIVEE